MCALFARARMSDESMVLENPVECWKITAGNRLLHTGYAQRGSTQINFTQ